MGEVQESLELLTIKDATLKQIDDTLRNLRIKIKEQQQYIAELEAQLKKQDIELSLLRHIKLHGNLSQ